MSNSVEQRAIDTAARAGFTSEEAEKSLIGSIAMNYDKCVHIVSELSEDDFYYEAYKAAFRAVKLAQALKKLCPFRCWDSAFRRSKEYACAKLLFKLTHSRSQRRL